MHNRPAPAAPYSRKQRQPKQGSQHGNGCPHNTSASDQSFKFDRDRAGRPCGAFAASCPNQITAYTDSSVVARLLKRKPCATARRLERLGRCVASPQ